MNTIKFDITKKIDIVLLGRVTIDLNPNEINRTLSESRTFTKYLGGSPANIAVGLARLGKKVGFIGQVSDDRFGQFVTEYFEKEGIDTSNISRAKNGESLGLTFTEILSPTESSILMYRNGIADLSLSPDEISEEYIKNSKVLLISGTSLAASPSREAAFTAMEYAKKNNTLIIFDIDYRSYNWKSKKEIAVYYSLAGKMSDIVIGSREEFDLMENLMVSESSNDEESAKRWFNYGNQLVIIKHGKDGSLVFSKNGEKYSVKPFPIKLLKSFGGGDGYASAFIYGLMEDWDLKDALEFGNASASMLVSSHSCSEAMPTASEIKNFIKNEKEKYGELVTKIG